MSQPPCPFPSIASALHGSALLCSGPFPCAPLLWPFPSNASALPGSASTVSLPLLSSGYWIRSSLRLQQASKHTSKVIYPFFDLIFTPCPLPYFVLFASVSRSLGLNCNVYAGNISSSVFNSCSSGQWAIRSIEGSCKKPTRSKDPTWKYAYWPNLQDKLMLQCTFYIIYYILILGFSNWWLQVVCYSTMSTSPAVV